MSPKKRIVVAAARVPGASALPRAAVLLVLILATMTACESKPAYQVSDAVLTLPLPLENTPMPEEFAAGLTRVFQEYQLAEILKESRVDQRPKNLVMVYRVRFELDGTRSYLDFYRGVSICALAVGDSIYELHHPPTFVVFFESVSKLDDRARDRLMIDKINANDGLQL